MKAAIYNPYLDTLGGGERYTLSFARVLADSNFKVDLEWSNELIRKKLEERFNINLMDINFVKSIKKGDGYDICFWVSDGSIPLLRARKNFLHFQIPFKDVGGKSLLNKMKLFRINKVICNSYFTKKFIDAEYGIDSIVVYPSVDILSIKPKKKENLILYIGRFSQLAQSKRQDILIKAFKMLLKKIEGFRLILAGGTEVGADKYLARLKRSIGNTPVTIIEDPSFEKLVSLYGRAKIFWSASGYSENENKNPIKVEHFGITLVEAMSAGCVPLAYDAGGHKEIIRDGKNGYLFNSVRDLVNKTQKLLMDKITFKILADEAVRTSKLFCYENFEKNIKNLL